MSEEDDRYAELVHRFERFQEEFQILNRSTKEFYEVYKINLRSISIMEKQFDIVWDWVAENCKNRKVLMALKEASGEYQEMLNQLRLKYPHALRDMKFK